MRPGSSSWHFQGNAPSDAARRRTGAGRRAAAQSVWLDAALRLRRAVPKRADGEEERAGAINLLPPAALLDGERPCDLFANFDGLTEQPEDSATRYWNYIRGRRVKFLSVNHEANAFTFRELYMRSADGTYEVDRLAFWLRQGYAEEIVTFLPVGTSRLA